MKHVLITLSGGIIDRVTFYDDPSTAVRELVRFVRKMDPEKDDAAVYGPDGLIATSKVLLDEDDQDSRSGHETKDVPTKDKPIYIMANPYHREGLLVLSPYESVGYGSPFVALSILEKKRKEAEGHINLYRLERVTGVVVSRKELEKYNADHVVDDFDYSLVSEFLR
jgi:hypothetical protein